MRYGDTKSVSKSAIRTVRTTFLAVALFSLVINVFMLATPLYMLQVYDRALVSRSIDTLIALTVLVIGLIAFNGFLELVRARTTNRLSVRFEAQLLESGFRAMFLHKINGSRGSSAQTLRDLEVLRGFLSGPGLAAIFDSPWIPVFIGLIFVFHPTLGAIALIGAALLFLLAVLSEIGARKPTQEAATLSSGS